LDHCAIYLLIAGSYTPFTLLLLKESWGWALFNIVWVLAGVGILFKIFFTHRFKILSTLIYLMMGWMVVVAAEPLMSRLPYEGLCWLIMGGLFYTIGVIFFVLDSRRFFHAIWHLFVMGGSVCHYFAILFYL
jgi:hemolysin III